MFERYGKSSIDDFVDNLSWKFSVAHSVLICVGTQHQYTVLVPDHRPARPRHREPDLQLLPASGSTASPVDDLHTSDSALFYTA